MKKSLQFHQRTFDFLGREPNVIIERETSLQAFEAFAQLPLPEAVREWLMMKDYASLIELNDDHVLPIDTFVFKPNPLFGDDLRWQTPYCTDSPFGFWGHDAKHFLTDDLLLFVTENQGVCYWAIDLYHSPDPPVWTKWSDTEARWLPCAASFSEFIFARIWDSQAMSGEWTLHTSIQPLSFAELGYLETNFTLLLTDRSHPHFLQCFRFERNDQQILIRREKRVYQPESDEVYLRAASANSLEELVQAVWRLSDLSKTFNDGKHTDAVETILRRLQQP
jgi:hypothetical protein